MMKMRKLGSKAGFTLIELSFSLVFIAILSLIIVLLINNTVSSYRRGLVLNQLNTTGMEIVNDMRAAVQDSSTSSVKGICSVRYTDNADISQCEADGGRLFVSSNKKAKVELWAGKTLNSVPVSGTFCTGTYTYIWNSGYYSVSKKGDYPKIGMAAAKIKYKYDGKVVETDSFRLLKIYDVDRSICSAAINTNKYILKSGSYVFDFGEVVREPVDLLSPSRSNTLALYDLSVPGPAEGFTTSSLFYSASFILGTVQNGINVLASGNFCMTPNNYDDQDFDYCAINKFNFAIRATGE